MIIDCISDLHGYHPKLEGGDLLIVAGDLTGDDKEQSYQKFYQWLDASPYEKKIVIAGNHDNNICTEEIECLRNCIYLCDSGTELENGLKIWGSPWTKTFEGMNPKCKAFTIDTEEELAIKFSLIPDEIDILITHMPPLDIFDKTFKGKHVGSSSLRETVISRIKPKLHVFGHIHECGGKLLDTVTTKFINASIVNEHYEHVNKPVRIIL